MKHKARRLLQFIAIKWLRLFETKKTREPSDYEKECFYVCKALINQEDSVLLMSPISGKRYIKSEDDQIFIIIEENQITIVNHNYSYNIDLWGTVLTRISNVFDIEVEKPQWKLKFALMLNIH